MQDSVFVERRVAVARLARDLVVLLRQDGDGLDDASAAEARSALERLKSRFGYEDVSAGGAMTALGREHLADLLS